MLIRPSSKYTLALGTLFAGALTLVTPATAFADDDEDDEDEDDEDEDDEDEDDEDEDDEDEDDEDEDDEDEDDATPSGSSSGGSSSGGSSSGGSSSGGASISKNAPELDPTLWGVPLLLVVGAGFVVTGRR